MNSNLQFAFLVDRENNRLRIKKEFAADQQLVWDVHTKSELLEKWFAPKPLTTKTESMDFREGGAWVYAMVQPNGTEHWGRMDYERIQPVSHYMGWDAFCDTDGQINTDLPRARWEVYFLQLNAHTLVETVVSYKTKEDLDTVLNMGMQEGITAALSTLDEVLASLKD